MESVAADMTMNIIITTTTESVAVDMTMSIITTTMESVAADMTMSSIITTTTESVVVDTTMTMDTTMQMMYLQAGELRLPINLQRKNLRTLYQNLQATNHLVMFSSAKGIVASDEGEWFHFDLVPEETELRRGAADYTGRICVIGSNLNEATIKELFHVA